MGWKEAVILLVTLSAAIAGAVVWPGWVGNDQRDSFPYTFGEETVQGSYDSGNDDGIVDSGQGSISSFSIESNESSRRAGDIVIPEGISLLALFQTHDRNIASAVVMIDGYGAYRYGVGENISDGYFIEDILPDHVVLKGNGGVFKLFLVPLSGDDYRISEAVSSPRSDGASILEETRAHRERMRMLSTYDIYPVSEGASDGYIIGERFPRQVLEETGTQPGDIIVSVNGYSVGDPSGDELALTSFRTTMKASVLIRRQDGSTMYFNYPEDAQ